MNEQSKAIAAFVEAELQAKGISSRDGLVGPACQTGEPYIELTIRARGIQALTTAAAGAVAAFGKQGDTCYWRTKADYDDFHGESVYLRFCCTSAPELETAA